MCICVCVCLCVCVCVRAYVCTYIYTHAARACVYIYTHAHTLAYVDINYYKNLDLVLNLSSYYLNIICTFENRLGVYQSIATTLDSLLKEKRKKKKTFYCNTLQNSVTIYYLSIGLVAGTELSTRSCLSIGELSNV